MARPYTREARSACRAPRAPAKVKLTPMFGGHAFDRPTRVARPTPGSPAFVLEKGGRILSARDDGDVNEWADLHATASEVDEEGGLLGLAISPDYARTGEIFVSYTATVPELERSESVKFRFVVARARDVGGGELPNVVTEPVLVLDRTDAWHHGGALAFGPEGALYVSTGDGAFGDPDRRAPDPNSPLGKILRIDVLGGERPYRLFPDNPFVLSGRAEVYATGFRNPWTMSFGPTGTLWVADVGHFRWEEIDRIERGKHYGWPDREGTHCAFAATCPNDSEPPYVEYSHVEGQAVVGGYEYRGKNVARFDGRYVYGDFVSGRIWTVPTGGVPSPVTAEDVVDTGLFLSGFAEDVDGELLVMDYASGKIFRLDPGDDTAEEPATLASLGCISGGDMDAALVPYDVVAPLFSDGLAKRRWLSVPDGEKLSLHDDGTFDFPTGTILLKEFADGDHKVETRMMVNDRERGWLGYSFAWNAEGTDATLLPDGATATLADGRTWDFPARSACATCHNPTAGRVLGFQASQLEHLRDAAGGSLLEAWARGGLVAAMPANPAWPKLVHPYDEGADLEARARSYIQGNCAHCHRTRGFDFRASASLEDMGLLCRPAYATHFSDAPELVSPGAPEASVLVRRIADTGELRMPPLGRRVVDEKALSLFTRWIGAMKPCTPSP